MYLFPLPEPGPGRHPQSTSHLPHDQNRLNNTCGSRTLHPVQGCNDVACAPPHPPTLRRGLAVDPGSCHVCACALPADTASHLCLLMQVVPTLSGDTHAQAQTPGMNTSNRQTPTFTGRRNKTDQADPKLRAWGGLSGKCLLCKHKVLGSRPLCSSTVGSILRGPTLLEI